MDENQMSMEFLEQLADTHGVNATGVTPKRKKQQVKKDRRWRCQFRFWVNANDQEQYELGESLAKLIRNHRFNPTILNALRLFFDLRAGRTEELFRQFSWVRAQVQPPTQAVDTSDLQRQIAELRSLLLAQKPETREPEREYQGEPELTVITGGKASAREVANNFLKSMSGFLD